MADEPKPYSAEQAKKDFAAFAAEMGESAKVVTDKAAAYFKDGMAYTRENVEAFLSSLEGTLNSQDLKRWREKFAAAPVETLGEAFTAIKDSVVQAGEDAPGTLKRWGASVAEAFGKIGNSIPGLAGAGVATALVFGVAYGITGADSFWSLNGIFTTICALGVATLVAPAAAVWANNLVHGDEPAPKRGAAIDTPVKAAAVEPVREQAAEVEVVGDLPSPNTPKVAMAHVKSTQTTLNA